MVKMTEEEAWALSDHFTNNEYTIVPNSIGWLTQREMRSMGYSNETIQYLLTKAIAKHKTPAQIVDELVSKELAAAI